MKSGFALTVALALLVSTIGACTKSDSSPSTSPSPFAGYYVELDDAPKVDGSAPLAATGVTCSSMIRRGMKIEPSGRVLDHHYSTSGIVIEHMGTVDTSGNFAFPPELVEREKEKLTPSEKALFDSTKLKFSLSGDLVTLTESRGTQNMQSPPMKRVSHARVEEHFAAARAACAR